jgi:hypothetical protein
VRSIRTLIVTAALVVAAVAFWTAGTDDAPRRAPENELPRVCPTTPQPHVGGRETALPPSPGELPAFC